MRIGNKIITVATAEDSQSPEAVKQENEFLWVALIILALVAIL